MRAVGFVFCRAGCASAGPPSQLQLASPDNTEPSSAPDSPPIMFPHQEWDRFWLSGQVNIISQWHPAFRSPYQGPNSLSPEAQDASSRVLTLFTGLRLTGTTALLCDVQETGGHGIGEALGLAGFTNLDVVRNPTLSKAPYIARLDDSPDHSVRAARKSLRTRIRSLFFANCPSAASRFDSANSAWPISSIVNSYGSDTNFQFMNWTVDNSGTYDYAADTRGYTFAAMLEYHDRWWDVRFAEALMPKVANGINLDADMGRARSEDIEFEFHGKSHTASDGCAPSADIREPREHG